MFFPQEEERPHSNEARRADNVWERRTALWGTTNLKACSMSHLQIGLPPTPPEKLSVACSVPRGNASFSNVIVSEEVSSAARRVTEPTSESAHPG